MRKLIVILSLLLMGSTVSADELTVRLNCKNGKCVPAQTTPKVDADQVQALRRSMAEARQALDRARSRAGVDETTLARLAKLEKAFTQLEEHVAAMDKALLKKTDLQQVVNVANLVLRLLDMNIAKLQKAASKAFDAIAETLEKLESIMEARRTRLDLSLFGTSGLTYQYGGGVKLALVLPMGQSWTTSLSLGFGVSPSNKVGLLAGLSVQKQLVKGLWVGPGVLYLRDMGTVLNTESNFVLAGTADLTYFFWREMFVSGQLYFGAGVKQDKVSIYYDAQFVDSPCGKIKVKDGYWYEVGKQDNVVPTFGGTVSLGWRFF